MAEKTLVLYGHPFSSYTWKVMIALNAAGHPYELREVSPGHEDNARFVAENAGPQGKFPVLVDGENILFESSSIIEYLAHHHIGEEQLIGPTADAAIGMRMLDRVFDNDVMGPTQQIVAEHLRPGQAPDASRCAEARARLDRSYAWLEGWLEYYPLMGQISLVECAAAPALFYADWVHPIADAFPRLRRFRAYLNAMPPVAQCIEGARPWRQYFPLGAPDRD